MREVVCTIVLDASARHDVEVDVRDFLAGVFACIIKQILQISRLGLAMEWNLGRICFWVGCRTVVLHDVVMRVVDVEVGPETGSHYGAGDDGEDAADLVVDG